MSYNRDKANELVQILAIWMETENPRKDAILIASMMRSIMLNMTDADFDKMRGGARIKPGMPDNSPPADNDHALIDKRR